MKGRPCITTITCLCLFSLELVEDLNHQTSRKTKEIYRTENEQDRNFKKLINYRCFSIEALSSDIIKQTHSNLEACAKACLEKKNVNCRFFKFVKASKTCYLSSKNTPEFNYSAIKVKKVLGTKATSQPKVTTTLKPSTVTSSTKAHVKTARPPMLKKYKRKFKKFQEKIKQVHKKRKKVKAMKKNLKNLSKLVKPKKASTAKENKKVSSKVVKQAKTLGLNSKYLRRLILDIAALKRQYAVLRSYQKRLHGKISGVIMKNKYVSKKMNLLHRSNSKLWYANIIYKKGFKKLWARNDKILKRILLLQRLIKKQNKWVPKLMRKYLLVIAASARKFGIMNNKIKKLVRVLLSLKIANFVNRRANNHIIRNLGHMTRSLRVLKLAIRRLASTVVGQIKVQKKFSKVTSKIPTLLANQIQMAMKLKQMKRKNSALFQFYSRMIKKLQKEDASRHIKITGKMNKKFSNLDKSVLTLQKQVRHLQMLIMNQLKLQKNSKKTADKTSKLGAKQNQMTLQLKLLKKQNNGLLKLYIKMMKKISKSNAKQKSVVNKIVKKLRKIKKGSINIVVGKIRHNPAMKVMNISKHSKPLSMRRRGKSKKIIHRRTKKW